MDNPIVNLIFNFLVLDLVLVNLTHSNWGTLVFGLPIEDNFVWNGLNGPMIGAIELQGKFLKFKKSALNFSCRKWHFAIIYPQMTPFGPNKVQIEDTSM